MGLLRSQICCILGAGYLPADGVGETMERQVQQDGLKIYTFSMDLFKKMDYAIC